MKSFCLTAAIAVFLLLCSNGIQAQTTQTESPKAGSEYNVLDAWSGIWNVQGEASDSISAPYYHVDWTLSIIFRNWVNWVIFSRNKLKFLFKIIYCNSDYRFFYTESPTRRAFFILRR
jgi:hypothetical protein